MAAFRRLLYVEREDGSEFDVSVSSMEPRMKILLQLIETRTPFVIIFRARDA